MRRHDDETKYACLPSSSWILVLASMHATASLARDLKLEEIGFDLSVQLNLEDEWKRVEKQDCNCRFAGDQADASDCPLHRR